MSIKYIALSVTRCGISVVSAFFRMLRRRGDRVVFLSRQSDAPSENFRMLDAKLRELCPGIETEYSCRLGLKQSMGLSYIPLLLRQLWMLAGARACVTESYCPPISLPRSHGSLRVVQIWHSMVAIKKFGWQTVGMAEGSDLDTARAMRMHAGYSAIVCGSEYQKKLFAEAMNTPVEKIHALGMPSADRLLAADREAAREAILREYPQTDGKRLIAYLPTMRRGRAVPWQELAEALEANEALRGKYALIIGLHPLDAHTERDAGGHDVIFDGSLGSRTLLLGSDAVISDYSGAAAEAALCGKELFFFVPDIEEYSGECGLNIDPRELFGEITSTDGADMARIMSAAYPDGMSARCRELLAGGCDGSSAERIARLILEDE